MDSRDLTGVEERRATVETNGTAITNSSLGSPLTSSTYCRKFYHSVGWLYGPSSASEVKSLISPSVQGGVFVNTNNAYALSLRAKVRMENQFCFGHHPAVGNFEGYDQVNYVGVTAYAPTSSYDGNSNFLFSGGYEVALQKCNGNMPLQLVIRAGQGMTTFNNIMTRNVMITCSGTYSMGQWYHIRMDVVPVSLTQKTINAYTSSDNGVTWDLAGTTTINSNDSSFRDSGNCGFISSKLQTSWNGLPSSYAIDTFIDEFKAYVST